jgi:TolA-binding protein
MIGKEFLNGLVICVFMITVVVISSCSGTRDDEPLINDQAFPGDPGGSFTNDSGSDASAEEAEVLRLLGISKDEVGETADSFDKSPGENDLSQLQGTLGQKDVEIENLKAAISAKDQQIENLERIKAERTAQPQPTQYSPPSSSGDSFSGQYDEALVLYNNKSYQKALNMFDGLLSTNANNSLVDNCQYWKGECYYGLLDYNQAALEFQKVFMFNNSNKLDDSQLKLGLCYIKLGNLERAKDELAKVLDNYPDSEYVSRAQAYLNQL